MCRSVEPLLSAPTSKCFIGSIEKVDLLWEGGVKKVCVWRAAILRLGGIAVLKLCNFVFEILTPEPLSFKIGGKTGARFMRKSWARSKKEDP